jgi:hypothetical protein
MKNILFAYVGLIGFLFGSATAHAGRLDVAGTTDVYGQVTAQNSSVGAGGEYWFTNNVGIGGGISGGIGNFDVINVRALLLLDNEFNIANSPARPFASAGLAIVHGPSYLGYGQTKGSGLEISGGVLWETPWVKNLYFRPEVIVHLFNVKTTYTNAGGSYTYDPGYRNVDAMFAAVYRF